MLLAQNVEITRKSSSSVNVLEITNMVMMKGALELRKLSYICMGICKVMMDLYHKHPSRLQGNRFEMEFRVDSSTVDVITSTNGFVSPFRSRMESTP